MLYLITESSKNLDKIIEISKIALEEGVDYLQIRNKEISSQELRNLTEEILSYRKTPQKTKIILNDHADLAAELDVDGLHIGQHDIDPVTARKIIGDKILGLSVETIAQAKLANQFQLDYIAASPVFYTKTKTDTAEPMGLSGLRAIKQISKFPVFAIGGINQLNTREALATGSDAVCLVSAVFSSHNPRMQIKIFHKICHK